MLIVTSMSYGSPQPIIILGASGSTMSLIGAYIAVMIRRNKDFPLKHLKRQIIFLILVSSVQFIIDYMTPQVSLTAHVSGLVFGLVTGYTLYLKEYDNPEPKLDSKELQSTHY